MSCDDEMIYRGPITFDVPVPLDAMEEAAVALLSSCPVVALYADPPQGRVLAGVRSADGQDGWAHSGTWVTILRTLEAIARRQERVLHTDAAFDSDERGQGRLVVDAGGRFHDCQEGDDPAPHRTRACICFPFHLDSETLFAVGEVTADERIAVRPSAAGPFTDYAVACEDHGEVACPPTEREAVFRREAHIVEAHTTRPLPLGRGTAAEALPGSVLRHLEDAAESLRQGRSYSAPLAIRYRDAARGHARLAEAELRRTGPADPTAALLRVVAELLAAADR